MIIIEIYSSELKIFISVVKVALLEENENMATKQASDQEFLEFIIQALVEHPEDVKVTRTVDEMGVLLNLKVNPEDMGRIIGREGSTARSIRALTRLVGLRHNARVNLKIEEPEGSQRAVRTESSRSVDQVVDDLSNI